VANERELKLKLTGDASQAEKAVARLEAALKKAEAELAKAKETTDKVDDSVEHLGSKTDHTGARLAGLGDAARPHEQIGRVRGDDIARTNVERAAIGDADVGVRGRAGPLREYKVTRPDRRIALERRRSSDG
jgi:chromosome segregation ATPase